MTTIDPKEDLPKPEKQEQDASLAASKDSGNMSLGEIAKPGKDALHQVKPPDQGDNLVGFGSTPSLTSSPANLLGRFSGFGLKRELDLSLSSSSANLAGRAQEQGSREFRWVQSTVNPGLIFPNSSRQFFRYLAGEEFKPSKEIRPVAEVKPLSERFLRETEPRPNQKLTDAERNDLADSRRQLREATNSADIFSKALHLARLYQHLRYIDEAKKALILSLGIDPDNLQVRELFGELERMHPVDLGITSQAMAQVQLTKSALRKRILSLSGGRVIVAGDLLIDELLEGKPERISREAPVLILEHIDTVLIPGGAANTAHNIAALGGSCHAVGVCGSDEYSRKLADLLTSCGISHSLVHDPSRPTTVKTRILSKSHSLMQQLLRMDRISHEPISPKIEQELIQRLEQQVAGYRAIVLSDYKAGVITDGIINACRQLAERHKVMVVVDAQQRFERFKGFTLMTPNQPDTEKAVGYPLDTREALIKAGNEILSTTGVQSLLITRGPEGMVLFERNQTMVELPAFNRSEVFDVTGAGDTVVGTMALALVTGASFVEAMALGNLAAGVVVRKSGTAVTSQKEMLDTLEALNMPE